MSGEQLLNLPDRRKVAFEHAGNPSSSTVIIFFSGVLSVGDASRISTVLESKGVHYIAPTLPGWGNTSPPARGVSYPATLAGDLTAIINHLHPDISNVDLYIAGGSFGTVAAQIIYGAPFHKFAAGQRIKGLLLLGSFVPVYHRRDGDTFDHTQYMNWMNYLSIGPPSRILPFRLMQRLGKLVLKSRVSSQSRAETFIRQFLFDKMGPEEKQAFEEWRIRKGMEKGQLEREMARNVVRSVQSSWEGFLSVPAVINGDWGWEKKGIEDLDEEHTSGRKVLVVAAKDDDSIPSAWADYLVSKYKNSRLIWIDGGHIAAIVHMDRIWSEFLDSSRN